MTIEFTPFPKIARYSRDIVITEKIDGTNAGVLIVDQSVANQDDHEMLSSPFCLEKVRVEADDRVLALFAQSRNRFIKVGDDNMGFAAWVYDHAAELVGLGTGLHFGEWWGRGIARNYGLKDRRWSLFNTARWDITAGPDAGDPGKAQRPPACCHVVPVLYRGPHVSHAVKLCLDGLRDAGSEAAPGFDKPEGIMIYHTAANVIFKKTLVGDDAGKEALARRGKAA